MVLYRFAITAAVNSSVVAEPDSEALSNRFNKVVPFSPPISGVRTFAELITSNVDVVTAFAIESNLQSKIQQVSG